MRSDRRRLLLGAAALAGAAVWPAAARAGPSRLRLILLGTGGGPRPRKSRAAPAQVIIAGDSAYVIDCGDGVARQLVLADVPLAKLRHVFLTHHHSDHNAGYGNLLLLAWTAGLRSRVDTWGPPPLAAMTRQFFALNRFDIDTRIADEGRVPLLPLVHTHELARAGMVLRDENVTVTAALVHHPPVVPAFAYRFDGHDRSIVISGDTTRSDTLIALARDADVLVHEVLYPAAIDRLVAGLPNGERLKRSIVAHHTAAEDVGRVAQAAQVKTLVLSHFVPAEDREVTDQMWLDAVARHFGGRIILGRDLLEI